MSDYNPAYPSVTEVLDLLRKIGLERWFKYNTLEFIEAESSKGKTIGTLTHRIFQAHIEQEKIEIETNYPGEVRNALESFMLFRKENPEIKLKKAEIKMSLDSIGINATLDCLASISKEEMVFDWKTGKCNKKEKPEIYEETIYQVSAYVNIYNELFGKDIKKAVIVALAKDQVAYNKLIVTEQVIKESFKEVFRPLLGIWYYKARNQYVEKKFRGDKSNGNNTGNNEGQRNPGNKKSDTGLGKESRKLPRSF